MPKWTEISHNLTVPARPGAANSARTFDGEHDRGCLRPRRCPQPLASKSLISRLNVQGLLARDDALDLKSTCRNFAGQTDPGGAARSDSHGIAGTAPDGVEVSNH